IPMVAREGQTRHEIVAQAVREIALQLGDRAVVRRLLYKILPAEVHGRRAAEQLARVRGDEIVPNAELMLVTQIEIEPAEQLRAVRIDRVRTERSGIIAVTGPKRIGDGARRGRVDDRPRIPWRELHGLVTARDFTAHEVERLVSAQSATDAT